MAFKLEHFSADAKRILHDGQLVAFALRLTSNRWGLYDRWDKRITTETFPTPKTALKAYEGISTQGAV